MTRYQIAANAARLDGLAAPDPQPEPVVMRVGDAALHPIGQWPGVTWEPLPVSWDEDAEEFWESVGARV